jgi:hypothetical protein
VVVQTLAIPDVFILDRARFLPHDGMTGVVQGSHRKQGQYEFEVPYRGGVLKGEALKAQVHMYSVIACVCVYACMSACVFVYERTCERGMCVWSFVHGLNSVLCNPLHLVGTSTDWPKVCF